ncbi:hypothetical protein [Spirochaeta cellobiosiphila]|uniref:hypothetical protein n=1 Tax=Spirochaeta cellobiosiphila TaxID=504483 RepID=UPI0004192170|nr:hypothetical protein [Spirochaeta cellobiosiphila]
MSLILAFLCIFFIGSCHQDGPSYDRHVKYQLKTLGFPYQIDDDGDFLIYRALPEGRKQNVWVSSVREKDSGIVYREIFSMAKDYKGLAPLEVSNNLLIQNYSENRLGAWSLLQVDNYYILLYIVRIPVNNDSNWLYTAITETALSADDMERRLSDIDQY